MNCLLNLICALGASDRDVDIFLSALSGVMRSRHTNSHNYAASSTSAAGGLVYECLMLFRVFCFQFDATVLFIQRGGLRIFQTNNRALKKKKKEGRGGGSSRLTSKDRDCM